MRCDRMQFFLPPGHGVEGGHSSHGNANDGRYYSSGDDAQKQVAERVGHTGLRSFGDLGHDCRSNQC